MISRRDFLASTAAATATAATSFPALAEAPMLGALRPKVLRVTLGGFEVTTLLDGTRPVEGPQGIFGQEQTVETVEALLAENMLPTNVMEFTFSPVLVNTGTNLILFDTGNGAAARPDRGNLAALIAEAGYDVGQVDTVVLTHMHGDHIGGVMENGSPTFPNAGYVTGAAEYDFWSSADRVGTPAENGHKAVVENIVPLAEKFRFINPGDAVASGVEAVEAFGHTPGHMAYHLESDGKRLLITADAANHFVLSLQRPDWEVRFDMDKSAAAATRKKLFGMLASDRIPFSGYHMPFPAMGFVEAAGDGFVYVPKSYQLNI